jgi:hypothetical protein
MSLRISKQQPQQFPDERSPLSANFPKSTSKTGLKQRAIDLLLYGIGSRLLAKRLMIVYAFSQLSIISYLISFFYQIHLKTIEPHTNTNNFSEYILFALPGTFLIPLSIGFTLWPSFLLFGLFTSRNSREIDTITSHIDFIKTHQLILFNKIHTNIFNQKMHALRESLGKIPDDVKLLIVEACRNDLEYEKSQTIGPLLWKPKYKLNPITTWTRVVSLWTLFTGVHDRYGIASDFKFTIGGLTVMVFSRDAFLVCLSCIVRYNLIIWITKSTTLDQAL